MNANNKWNYCSFIPGSNLLTPNSLGPLYITAWQSCELNEEHRIYQQWNRLNQSHWPTNISGDVLSTCGIIWVYISLPRFMDHLCQRMEAKTKWLPSSKIVSKVVSLSRNCCILIKIDWTFPKGKSKYWLSHSGLCNFMISVHFHIPHCCKDLCFSHRNHLCLTFWGKGSRSLQKFTLDDLLWPLNNVLVVELMNIFFILACQHSMIWITQAITTNLVAIYL